MLKEHKEKFAIAMDNERIKQRSELQEIEKLIEAEKQKKKKIDE